MVDIKIIEACRSSEIAYLVMRELEKGYTIAGGVSTTTRLSGDIQYTVMLTKEVKDNG